MNMHLSEIVSDLLEPLVGTLPGGEEVISTEDLLARIDDLNLEMKDWDRYSWWEGKRHGNLEACGRCRGNTKLEGNNQTKIELCTCGEYQENNETVRVTSSYLQYVRRKDWEEKVGWDPTDKEKEYRSESALPEDLQDYTIPMVLIGGDVVSLYPSLDVRKIVKWMREAVMKSSIKWEGVDYGECARYIVLNWEEDKCRRSVLRRVLPVRRSRQGTKPGIKGKGPRGKERGDMEQWVFPSVSLTEEEKLLLIATVIEIACITMFQKHYYNFGGKVYHQEEGGPIGLRGTCAVARVTMQLFDGKWKTILDRWGIMTWLISRYMDDLRTMLAPIRRGWRATLRGLTFCQKWWEEDSNY